MNSKERVSAALEHRKADRFPLAYEVTFEVTTSLIEHFGLDKNPELVASQVGTFNSPVGEKAYGVDHEIALQKILGVDLAKVACPTNQDKTIGNWFGLRYCRV